MDSINQRFDFLELVPVPISILDFETKTFVKTNRLFNNILKIEENQNFKASEIIKSSDIALDDILEIGAKEIFIFFKTSDSAIIPLVTTISKYNIDNKVYLLFFHKEIIKSLDKNLVIEDFPYSMDIKNILENIPMFACILSLNKKEIIFANASCRRIFGNNYYKRPASDFFIEIGELDELDNNTLSNKEFNSVIGSKWFSLSASYITFEDRKSVLILGKDISIQKKNEDTIIFKATIDDLTKTYNKQAGIDFLNDYLLGHNINKNIFTAVYIEFKGIKDIMDTHGLSEGDNYILNMVSIIRSAIRQTDIFSRLYHAEFLILFPNCVKEVVQNIMKSIENKLSFINTQELNYDYEIKYNILEITPNMELNSDDVFKILSQEIR